MASNAAGPAESDPNQLDVTATHWFHKGECWVVADFDSVGTLMKRLSDLAKAFMARTPEPLQYPYMAPLMHILERAVPAELADDYPHEIGQPLGTSFEEVWSSRSKVNYLAPANEAYVPDLRWELQRLRVAIQGENPIAHALAGASADFGESWPARERGGGGFV